MTRGMTVFGKSTVLRKGTIAKASGGASPIALVSLNKAGSWSLRGCFTISFFFSAVIYTFFSNGLS